MCSSVIAHGREYATPRQLADLVGGEGNLVWRSQNPFERSPEEKDWRDLDLCLCGIDVAATLSGVGLRSHLGDDPMQHFIE